METEIIATGGKLVGSGIRSFSSSIKSLFESSNDIIVLTAYILSEENVIKYILDALRRGVIVDILMNDSEQRKNNSELYKLETEFQNLRIYPIKEALLHSMVLISDNCQ
jgi:putative cell wall-binding protein